MTQYASVKLRNPSRFCSESLTSEDVLMKGPMNLRDINFVNFASLLRQNALNLIAGSGICDQDSVHHDLEAGLP